MSAESEQQSKYKPLTRDQKYDIREAQFQLTNTEKIAQQAIQQATQNLRDVIERVGIANGLTKDDKVIFQLDTLEFTDPK
jgi:hypothetical protein